MTDILRQTLTLTTGAMIAVVGVGLWPSGSAARAGNTISLQLAGGSGLAAPSRATLRQTGADAIVHETTLDLTMAPDDSLQVTLPMVESATLSEITLATDGEMRW